MELLRQWRDQHGHSQARLADAIDVHPTAISKIENGKNSMDLETFYRLIRYTGIDAMAALVELFESNTHRALPLEQARKKRARA